MRLPFSFGTRYGLPSGTNAFFEDECNGVVIAIYFQMVREASQGRFFFSHIVNIPVAKMESLLSSFHCRCGACFSMRFYLPSFTRALQKVNPGACRLSFLTEPL